MVNAAWDGFSAFIESLLAYIVLGERFGDPNQYIGIGLIIAGLFFLKIPLKQGRFILHIFAPKGGVLNEKRCKSSPVYISASFAFSLISFSLLSLSGSSIFRIFNCCCIYDIIIIFIFACIFQVNIVVKSYSIKIGVYF